MTYHLLNIYHFFGFIPLLKYLVSFFVEFYSIIPIFMFEHIAFHLKVMLTHLALHPIPVKGHLHTLTLVGEQLGILIILNIFFGQ